MEQRVPRASFQSLISMMITTPITVRKFGIRLVIVFFITSFNELTSPMILARILPVGLLSKNVNDKVCMCSYSSCLISRRILLAILFMRKSLSSTVATYMRLSTTITRIILTSPFIFLFATSSSMAYSISSGLSRFIPTPIKRDMSTGMISFMCGFRYPSILEMTFL